MSQVFISYCTQDAQIAKEVVSMLESRGISCWHADRDLPAGSEYGAEIPQALEEAKYFLLVLSEAAQKSVNVPRELERAAASRKVIIPLKTDQAPLGEDMDFLLASVQVRDFTRAKQSVLENIASFIKSAEPTAPELKTDYLMEEAPVYHVFVSHSTADDQQAKHIVEHLEKQKIRCWIAPRDTRSHTTYPAQITQAVRSCPVFLLLVSKKAMESAHVEREISLAIDKHISPGYKYIIPLMLENCTLTDEFCYYLANLHYYAYGMDEQGILAKITAQIHQFIEKEKASEQDYLNQGRSFYKENKFQEAFHYYQKAAQLGNREAQGMLGYFCHVGKGCDKNVRKAVYWYEKSISGEESNDVSYLNVMANLAVCYAYEGEVTRDYARAADLFRKAAEKGNPGAQRHLGTLYKNGTGVPKDPELAKYWYKKAADQGDQSAAKLLQELT